MLRIKVFWDVLLGSMAFFQDSSLQIMAEYSFGRSGINNPASQYNNQEDLNPQLAHQF
jgi:hypothetical protein